MVAYTFYEADNRVRRYAEALAERGDEVDVIALRRSNQPRLEFLKGVRVYRIQNRSIDEKGPLTYLPKLLLFLAKSAWMLVKKIFTKPYSVIHVHSVPDFEVFAAFIPRLFGSRVILDIHDIVPEFYASKFGVQASSGAFRALALIEKVSIACSDHVIISNHLWQEKLIARSVEREKCMALINYPNLSVFSRRANPRRSTDAFTLCYPGTLNQHQGVDIAVRAIARLRHTAPNLRFNIIGDGPERENLKSLIRQLEVSQQVSIQGFVPIESIAEVMAGVDLGIVPKRSNSFGNEAFSTKIMEFMAMGVPVLASRTRIDEYYFNQELVEYFEPDNVEDLASKILALMHDADRRKQLQRNSLVFIRENNWEEKKKIYLDLVDRLAQTASKTSARAETA